MKSRGLLGALALALLLVAGAAHPAAAQQTPIQNPELNVVYEVQLSQHFGLFGGTTQLVTVTVSGSTPGPSNGSLIVNVDFQFVLTGVQGMPPGSNHTLSYVSQHPLITQLSIQFPANTSSFDFQVLGTQAGSTLVYRGAVTLNIVGVAMNAAPHSPTSYQVLFPLSSSFDIVSVFPGAGPGITTQDVKINGTAYLSTGFSYAACLVLLCSVEVGANTISLIYQPAYFNYFLAAYLVLIVSSLVAAGILIRGIRRGTFQRAGAQKLFERVWSALMRVFTSLDSKKLLAILVSIGVVMVSLALAFGPSPAPRAYLAANPSTVPTLAPYITGAGYTYLTPAQAGDEFDQMSALNSYYVVIVADYPPALQSTGLLSSTRIIAISGITNATLIQDLKSYFGPNVVVVSSPQQLQIQLEGWGRLYTSNHLGLPVSAQTFSAVAFLEGLLSLTIPFFALAFFARYMIESSSRGLARLAFGAGFSFFIFLFGELVFIQTDVLLTLPVALHATISSAETAIGVLGFGGGSRPRMVMAFLGFLFGTFAGSLKGSKVDRVVLTAIVSACLFLLADPLQLGQDFYNILLNLLTSQPGTAFGQAAYTQLRSFVLYFMNAFGNYITPTFYSQHGAVLFFAGAIPFGLYTYVRKSTSTLLLFFCALVSAVGYVRIGDQDPLKAVASTTPGFAMAVLFVVAFLASDRVERFLRLRLSLG